MKSLGQIFLSIIVLVNFFDPLFAQTNLKVFEEGQKLLEDKEYYDAYIRFDASAVLSKNSSESQFEQESRKWRDKAAQEIQQQQNLTLSSLKAIQRITDAYYFYDDRLALAYKEGQYGYINKKGEIEINFQYVWATNFDKTTGYAKVTRTFNGPTLWLAPDGIEYPGTLDINNLPKILKNHPTDNISQAQEAKTLNAFLSTGKAHHHQVFNQGIQLFNQGEYFDAYLRFNAVVVLAENESDGELARLGDKLKDTAIYELHNLFSITKYTLSTLQKIRNAFYFYENKIALAFNNRTFYFIDKSGKEYSNLGRWEKAIHFDDKGFAKVEKAGQQFLLDTTGRTYKVAYKLADLRENVTALDLRETSLDRFPTDILNHSQLEVLLLKIKYNLAVPLPNNIEKLAQLKFLMLNNFTSDTLPNGFSQLRQLISLDLSRNKLKILSPEIGKLQRLTFLDLSRNSLKKLPPEIGTLPNLTSLDLSSNRYLSLPTEVGEIQSLTSLDISSSSIRKLPIEITSLRNLTSLDLSYNELSQLPSEFAALNSLTSLDLSRNKLAECPPEISQLHKLTYLNLSYNTFRKFPLGLTKLKNLTSLDLRENSIWELSSSIGQLQNLISLNLSLNGIRSLPSEIGQLQNLSHFNLADNSLEELPTEMIQLQSLTSIDLSGNSIKPLSLTIICQLQNLTHLNLTLNKLYQLPPEIGQLQSLVDLDLSGNGLNKLPSEIIKLQNLKFLKLMINGFHEFPTEICRIKKLTILDLSSNHLIELPSEISQLQNLTTLDIRHNKLKHLPSEIGKLQNLIFLKLTRNQLTKLPPEIGALNYLHRLTLNLNELDQLPPTIGDLQNLSYLDLSKNNLNHLPSEIGKLKNLIHLDLNNNQLNQIPATFGDLQNLLRLYLEQNILRKLPPEIGQLHRLTSLNLKTNQLKDLPVELGQLKNLTYLDLQENPILDEAQERIRQLLPHAEIKFSEIDYRKLAVDAFYHNNFEDAYLFGKKNVEIDPGNSSDWYNLSRFAIYAQNPQAAINAAQKALELAPDDWLAETQLALGYLLNDQWVKAKKIYEKWNGKVVPIHLWSCNEIFLQNLKSLEEAGIYHADFAKVKRLLEE